MDDYVQPPRPYPPCSPFGAMLAPPTRTASMGEHGNRRRGEAQHRITWGAHTCRRQVVIAGGVYGSRRDRGDVSALP